MINTIHLAKKKKNNFHKSSRNALRGRFGQTKKQQTLKHNEVGWVRCMSEMLRWIASYHKGVASTVPTSAHHPAARWTDDKALTNTKCRQRSLQPHRTTPCCITQKKRQHVLGSVTCEQYREQMHLAGRDTKLRHVAHFGCGGGCIECGCSWRGHLNHQLD